MSYRFIRRAMLLIPTAIFMCTSCSLLGLDASSGAIAKSRFVLTDDIAITSIAWTADGKYIVTASTHSKKIHVWDVERRKRIREFERTVPGFGQRDMAVDPTGHFVAICDGALGKLRLYDPHSWAMLQLLSQEHDRRCLASAFSSDGEQLAILGDDLTVYDTSNWSIVRLLDIRKDVSQGIPATMRAVAYVPGSHNIVLGGNAQSSEPDAFHQFVGNVFLINSDDVVPSRKFEAYTYRRTPPPPDPAPDMLTLAISPDGREVATGTHTGSGFNEWSLVKASVHVLNLQSGALLGAPLDDRGFGPPEGLCYTPDGRYLIVAHGGFVKVKHAVHVIDAKTLQVLDTVDASGTIYSLAIRPDSAQFAVGAGGTVVVWSLLASRRRQQ